VWQRTATTTVSGTSYSEPTCIQGATGAKGDTGSPGAAGKDGEDGLGVSAVVEQYYLSTSSTAQAGGSWGTAQPAWQSGRYIWTRSQVTWSDGTVTITDPVLAKAVNGANELANQASVTAEGAAETATAAKQTADAAQDSADSLSTLIRQSDSGIDVGKSADGSTYDTPVTRMGSDGAFHVLTKALVEVAKFGENVIELGKESASAVISMCDDHVSITANDILGTGTAYSGEVYSSMGVVLQAQNGPSSRSSVGIVGARGTAGSGGSYLFVDVNNVAFGSGEMLSQSRMVTALQPVVLYNGGAALGYDTAPGAGTNGNVSLSETAANFRRLDVYFRDNDGTWGSVSVPSPDGRSVCCFAALANETGGINYKTTTWSISGKTATRGYSSEMDFDSSGSATAGGVYYHVYVVRVEGVR
jgi:hypothetical protein